MTSWLTADIPLSPECALRLKRSYVWFLASVAFSLCGGWLGTRTELWLRLFDTWTGWVIAVVMLQLIPPVINAARRQPWLAVIALMGNGMLSGFLMAPVVAFLAQWSAGMVLQSSAVTAIVFGVLSVFVLSRNQSFAGRRALTFGLMAAAAGVVLSAFLVGFHWLSFPLAALSGALGVLILTNATTELLQDRDQLAPIGGALVLFLATFNVLMALSQIGSRAIRRA